MIASLHARRVRRGLVPALTLLQEHGLRILAVHPLASLDGVAAIVRLAQERDVRLIVTAGGDGTVGAVVNQIAGTAISLGVLPLGTSNDFARSLHVPLDLAGATRLVAMGTPMLVDMGMLITARGTTHYFVHAAILGLNSRFARLATAADWRRRYGRLAYPIAAFHAVRNRQTIYTRVSADQTRIEGPMLQVSVLNAPVFAGALNLSLPDSTLDDHRLDLLAIGDVRLRHLLQAVRVLVGRNIRRVPHTYLSHPRHIRIETAVPVEVTCDGEFVGHTPVTIRIAPRILSVIAPGSHAVGAPVAR